jgi:hypothetical protein
MATRAAAVIALPLARFSGGRYAVLEAQTAADGATIRGSYRLPGYGGLSDGK